MRRIRPFLLASLVVGFVAALGFAVAVATAERGPDVRPAAASEIPVPTSPSRTIETVIFSQSLGFEVPYLVYLPPGYDSQPDRRYPVLYMLHGLGGDRYMARVQGLFTAADNLILEGEIEPLIIIAPEGQRSYWVNHAENGPRWGNYITVDLVQEVDSRYRTVPKRASRAIGGISMGGHGALQLAMTSNEFGVVGAHSVALRKYEEAFPFFGDRAYFEAHDPVSLCRKYRERAQSMKIWIDIGSEDIWYRAATDFHQLLESQDIKHEWRVFPGAHDIDYWRAHAYDYLKFYDRALEKPRT